MSFIKEYYYSIAFFSILLLIAVPSKAQDDKRGYNTKQNMAVVLTKEPEFKGGEKALYQYFKENLRYSNEAISKKAAGEVMVSFDVMPDSSLTNFKVLRSVDESIDSSIIRLFKQLKFGPSIQNGTALRMNMIISIPVRATFNLNLTN